MLLDFWDGIGKPFIVGLLVLMTFALGLSTVVAGLWLFVDLLSNTATYWETLGGWGWIPVIPLGVFALVAIVELGRYMLDEHGRR